MKSGKAWISLTLLLINEKEGRPTASPLAQIWVLILRSLGAAFLRLILIFSLPTMGRG
jgi:hypothetical protein